MEKFSRRQLLVQSLRVSLSGIVLSANPRGAEAEEQAACVDPESLSAKEKGLRRSLEYVEMAPDQSKFCHNCGFYLSVNDACGYCEIFKSPVRVNGFCKSWSLLN